MYHESEALTDREAQAIAREWVDNRIEKPAKHYTFSQTRWVMSELANICVAESLRNREREEQLCERLAVAWDILHGIWYESAPEFAKKIRWGDDEKPDEEEQARIDAARHLVWHRRDPKRSFEEGFESEHHISFDRDHLRTVIASYLKRPWLRQPYLDWILIDMTISREICAFGEILKARYVPGKRHELFGFHHKYLASRGNLARMTETNWSELAETVRRRLVWTVGVPLGAIWAAFYFGYPMTGRIILVMYVCVVAIFLMVKLFGWSRNLARRMLGTADPRLKPFLLWEQMYEVWRRLDGPVVNPTRVRAAMVKSSEEGAVWDEATWSLIDRVVAVDPTAWVVQPSRD